MTTFREIFNCVSPCNACIQMKTAKVRQELPCRRASLIKIRKRHYAVLQQIVRLGYIPSVATHCSFTCLTYNDGVSTGYFRIFKPFDLSTCSSLSFIFTYVFTKVPFQDQRCKCAKKQEVLNMTIKMKKHTHKLANLLSL